MYKFNRIFDRNDVVPSLEVGVIHHRREGRVLAGTRRSGHQDQSLLEHGKSFQDRRETKLVQGHDVRRNQAKDGGDTVFLLKEVRAVAGDSRHFVSEVDVGSFFEDFDFSLRRNLVNHRLELVALQRREIHPHQIAIDAQHRRIACGKMQIGSLLLGHQFEESINARHERPVAEKLN